MLIITLSDVERVCADYYTDKFSFFFLIWQFGEELVYRLQTLEYQRTGMFLFHDD